MKNFDEPQDVIRMLQSPATDAELEGRAAAVDMMAGALASHVAVRRGRRPYRLGALIAAGVIGFGSVAAAGPGGFDPFQLGPTPDDVENDTVIVEDSPVLEDQPDDVAVVDEVGEEEQESTEDEVEADEPVAPAAVEEAIVPAEPVVEETPDSGFDMDRCVEDAPHGATVSAVARGDEGFEDLDVVDAAHSDCGKKTAGGQDVESEADQDLDEDVAEAPEASDDAETKDDDHSTTERSGGEHPGKGNGGKGGNSSSNGKGKGGRGD